RGVPVLREKAGAFGLLLRIPGAVVLQNDVLPPARRGEGLSHGVGVLLDDARIWREIDHAAQTMPHAVLQREGEAGQRLAAPRGDRQRIEARRIPGSLAASAQNLGADTVDAISAGLPGQRGDVALQRL